MTLNTSSISFRRLGPSDRGAVARAASTAFAGSDFYQRVLGLDDDRFARYWHEFFRLALHDPAARVFVFEHEGRMVAALAVAYDGFPRPLSGVRFLLRLLRAIGVKAWLRYLRFAGAYTRTMHRPAQEQLKEACGLWLFVDPAAGGGGVGSDLVRSSIAAARTEGKALMTGFVDAGNGPLLTFYRRLGFRVTPEFSFLGERAAKIELLLTAQENDLC